MATVLHIFRAPKRRPPMEDLAEASAVHEFGLEGCAHARSGSKRQLLLMDSETVDAMDLRTRQPARKHHHKRAKREWPEARPATPSGARSAGSERSVHPCGQMEKIRPGLRRELWGRRGMLCRVIEGGTIRRCDRIYLQAHILAPPTTSPDRPGKPSP
jgi:hypothetical protein